MDKLVTPKKYLGQHFLHDMRIARRVVQQLQPAGRYDTLVEVGPGKGVLTSLLLERKQWKQFLVVEVDADMIAYLKSRFSGPQPGIHHADFLKWPARTFVSGKFGVIGNFPYHISTAILFRILEYRDRIPEVVGMFQQEVAARIAADPGSRTYGRISALLQPYYDIKECFSVAKGAFQPPPEVRSKVVRLTRTTNQDPGCDPTLYKEVVKVAFSQRRKMLRNTLRPWLKHHTERERKLEKYLTQRPEALHWTDFARITQVFEAE